MKDARPVLVVDDDLALQELIVNILRKAGFAAAGVASGTEALAAAAADPALLLLLDQRLADMTGREVVLELAARGINTPFLMMTGQGNERLAVEMLQLGAAEYLVKDTDLLDLLPSVIERACRNLATQDRLRAAEESLKRNERMFSELSRVLSSLGTDFTRNMEELTALAGLLLDATCALYNRLQEGMLCSLGQWHSPPDYDPEDKPEGHICHDVILKGGREPFVVRNLPATPYMDTDPNVARYSLRTYIGSPVWCGATPVGSLCVVYQKDVDPTPDDLHILTLIASALSGEEARELAALALQQQVEEKDLLLRETHHRIKNNIAQIAGLLHLQSEQTANPEAITALLEARSRVNRMQGLYERMLRTGDYQELDGGSYLRELVDSVTALFTGDTPVRVEKEITAFPLGTKTVFPLGIIVNELLTNSLKYAFIGRGEGWVRITAGMREGRVTVCVEDNGIGLPEDYAIDAASGFGMTLVRLLCRQIGAAITIDGSAGTKITLTFTA